MTIPEEYLVEQSISINIGGQSFDFTIQASIFGEVRRVDNLFLELPEEAQRLMLGKEMEEITGKITGHAKLFRYKLPLAVNGFFTEEALTPLVEKIQQVRKELKIPDKTIDLNYLVEDAWTDSTLRRIYRVGKKTDSKIYLSLQCIKNILTPDGPKFYEGIRNLAYYKLIPADEILLDLISMQQDENQLSHLFRTLEHYPSADNLDELLHHFQKAKQQEKTPLISSILCALSPYKSDIIYEAVIDLHQNQDKLPEDVQIGIFKCLKNFKTAKTKAIAWEGFVGKSQTAGNEARKILTNWKVSEEEMVNVINPLLLDASKIKHWGNLLNQLHFVKNHNLKPPAAVFLDILEIGTLKSINLTYHTPTHLEHRYEDSVHERLYTMLFHEDWRVIKAAVSQMNLLVMEGNKSGFRPAPKMIKRLLTLIEHENGELARLTIRMLSRSTRVVTIEGFLLLMLSKIDEENIPLTAECMSALHEYFKYNPFEKIADQELQPFLNSPNHQLRNNVLYALRQTKNEEILRRMNDMAINDPSQEVKNSANRFKNGRESLKSLKKVKKLVAKLDPTVDLSPSKNRKTNGVLQPNPVVKTSFLDKIKGFWKSIFK